MSDFRERELSSLSQVNNYSSEGIEVTPLTFENEATPYGTLIKLKPGKRTGLLKIESETAIKISSVTGRISVFAVDPIGIQHTYFLGDPRTNEPPVSLVTGTIYDLRAHEEATVLQTEEGNQPLLTTPVDEISLLLS